MSPTWKEMPDVEGWYFTGERSNLTDRWKGEWIYVLMVSEEEGDPVKPCIWSKACEGLLDVPAKRYPIKRWYGPVEIDEET